MSDYLELLNEPQRKAVEATEGPVMVIAGAGSGKTRVLTYRIAHLMNKGVDSFNILALTFTNKAAKEMKERISKVVGTTEAKNLWMGTFHSVFARMLRVEAPRLGYPSNFTIYDQQDALSVIRKVITELQLDKEIYKPKTVLNRISQFKNNLITVRSYFNNPELLEADAAASRPKMGDLYRAYVERCFRSGAMDFDDLLLRTNEVLTRFPEVLAKYQERFKYILVDEYQDTNHSQYLIVKALASRYENLCVVGDDAQSIYAFRGANIRNILGFVKDYPDAKTYPLEQNYRSTQIIVKAANSIIKHNKDQLQKNVWTSNVEGEKIPVYRALSDADEARYVANEVFELKMEKQYNNNDFAVLYRTNAQSRSFEEAFRKKNIPYRVYGGLSFYQRKEIKDLVAYLRLLINSNDEEALLRIINYPLRSIGKTTIQKLMVYASDNGTTFPDVINNFKDHYQNAGLNSGTTRKIMTFATMLESFRVLLKTHDVYEVATEVAKQSGLLKDLRTDETPEGISRLENIQELLTSIQGFVEEQKQLEDGNPSLQNFLEDVALATDADSKSEDEDHVILMTVHLAKGLEFPNVFVVGLEENLFPSSMNMSSRLELEEERRLFYVALTRAEKKAYLTYSTVRMRWGKIVDGDPSRFLEELDSEFLVWVNPMLDDSTNNSGLNADIFGGFTDPVKRAKINSKKKFKPAPSNLTPLAQANISKGKEQQVIKEGYTVIHDRFGKGVIVSLDGEPDNAKATIKFATSGEKKLLLKFAKLRVLSKTS